MDAPRVSLPASTPPVTTAWPRSAQLAAAFLLGVAGALVFVHALGSSRWGSRPTDLYGQNLPAYRINLNAAGKAELLQLPGVGESLAERIDGYRREYGAFRQVEDLEQIHGVGPATVERLRPWIRAQVDATASDRLAAPAHAQSPRTTGKKTVAASTRDLGTKKIASLKGLIDVNRASEEELQRLPGVGPKMAQRIVAERVKKRFESVDDLRRVSGIGPKTLERLRPFVTVDGTSLRVAAAAQS
jgi:competence protein ComEA